MPKKTIKRDTHLRGRFNSFSSTFWKFKLNREDYKQILENDTSGKFREFLKNSSADSGETEFCRMYYIYEDLKNFFEPLGDVRPDLESLES